MLKKFAPIFITILFLFSAVVSSFLFTGCSSGSDVEFEVEPVDKKEGENLYPLKKEILDDAKAAVEIWIKNPQKIEEAFTGTALQEYKAARELDKKEGVKKVRVHKDQKFIVVDLKEGKRPQVDYEFLDMSYFVDAKTGKPKTKPYNKKRTVTIFLVKEEGRYKIDSFVGSSEAIR